MNSVCVKIITVQLLLLSVNHVSAQERDLFKQLIKESIKIDLKKEMMQSESFQTDTLSRTVTPEFKDSLAIDEESELSEYLLAPYTNPKYNPTVSQFSKYEYRMPAVTYKEMSAAGQISVTGLMDKVSSIFSGKKKKKKSTVSYSETEKEIIIEKTNEIIENSFDISTEESEVILE